jgi:hypothetical protein
MRFLIEDYLNNFNEILNYLQDFLVQKVEKVYIK